MEPPRHVGEGRCAALLSCGPVSFRVFVPLAGRFWGGSLLPLGRRAHECQSWKEVSRSTEGLSSVGASTE